PPSRGTAATTPARSCHPASTLPSRRRRAFAAASACSSSAETTMRPRATTGEPMRPLTLLLLATALAGHAAPLAAQRLGGLELLSVPAGARTASLAGAVTAVGGDLEAVADNPAAAVGRTAALAFSRADAPDLYQHYLFAGGTALRGIADAAA